METDILIILTSVKVKTFIFFRVLLGWVAIKSLLNLKLTVTWVNYAPADRIEKGACALRSITGVFVRTRYLVENGMYLRQEMYFQK